MRMLLISVLKLIGLYSCQRLMIRVGCTVRAATIPACQRHTVERVAHRPNIESPGDARLGGAESTRRSSDHWQRVSN